jgi:hypothetical protein
MNWQLLIDELKNTPGAQKDAYGIEETTEHWHTRLLRMKWRRRLERVIGRKTGIEPYSSDAARKIRGIYNTMLKTSNIDEYDYLLSLEESAQQRDKERMLEKLDKYYPDAKQILKNGGVKIAETL